MELRVTDKNGAVAKTMPLANLESLSVLGSVQITTQAIHALAGMNKPVAFLSPAGRLVALIDPLDSVSAGFEEHRFVSSTVLRYVLNWRAPSCRPSCKSTDTPSAQSQLAPC